MRFLWLAMMAVWTGAAAAQTVDEKTARSLLFSVRGEAVALASDLSERDKAILREVIKLSASQMNRPLYYYASIAYSPDEGLMSEALQSSANHHGVAAADAAALAACNAARASGTAPCRIGARVLPRGYEARGFELSLGATAEFDKTYRKIRGAKALAVSPLSGIFAIAQGPGAAAAAIADCNARSRGANDCRVAIAD